MSNRDYDAEYDENVDYDALEQHTYDDAPGHIFYTCPKWAMNTWLLVTVQSDAKR